MQDILDHHKITAKTTVDKKGVKRQYYSIQFTYPQGHKRQFTGQTEEIVRNKVKEFLDLSTTYEELCEMWIQDMSAPEDLRPKQGDPSGVKKMLPFVGQKLAREVTMLDLVDAAKKLISEGLKAGTVNGHVRAVRHLYQYAIKKEIVNSNPAEAIKPFQDLNP